MLQIKRFLKAVNTLNRAALNKRVEKRVQYLHVLCNKKNGANAINPKLVVIACFPLFLLSTYEKKAHLFHVSPP